VAFPAVSADNDDAVRACLDAIPEREVLDAARAVLEAPNCEAIDAASPHEVATGAAVRPPYFATTFRPAAAAVRRR
jgi:hypothetical protein